MLDFFSIGFSCTAAHQIRRYTSLDSSYFFDWILTPAKALDFFSQPDDNFLCSGNWEIVGEIRLLDKGSGLMFMHDFAKIGSTEAIDPERVESHLETVKSKYVYLKQKTTDAINRAERCVLIRYENEIHSMEEAGARASQIRKIVGRLNSNVKIVIASINAEREESTSEFIFVKMRKGANWTGYDASWNRLFAEAEKVFEFRGR